jgi:hypothetical protein
MVRSIKPLDKSTITFEAEFAVLPGFQPGVGVGVGVTVGASVGVGVGTCGLGVTAMMD